MTTTTPKEVRSEPWVDVNDRLPPMFKNVAVFGMLNKEGNESKSVYQARRWTGSSGGGVPPESQPWGWYTPHDFPVTSVSRWMPLPDEEEPSRPVTAKDAVYFQQRLEWFGDYVRKLHNRLDALESASPPPPTKQETDSDWWRGVKPDVTPAPETEEGVRAEAEKWAERMVLRPDPNWIHLHHFDGDRALDVLTMSAFQRQHAMSDLRTMISRALLAFRSAHPRTGEVEGPWATPGEVAQRIGVPKGRDFVAYFSGVEDGANLMRKLTEANLARKVAP